MKGKKDENCNYKTELYKRTFPVLWMLVVESKHGNKVELNT